MTEKVENDIKVKNCKICGISSEFNKFNGRECIKCKSKKNNEKLKEKLYYKSYYDENKELLLENVAKYYIEIRKPKLQNNKPVGRPKKNLCL